MKVLLVHNFYQQRSGEAVVFERDAYALRQAGIDVVEFTKHNDEIAGYSLPRKLTLPGRTLWSLDACRELEALIQKERPSLAHFLNTLPLISPAAYIACQRQGVAVVQSLQNYRLACPAATFVRDGKICEECVDHGLQRSIIHACYRDSVGASATVAAMLTLHRALGTYRTQVDAYIAPTRFVREKLVASAHLPAERVELRPNFVHPDPGVEAERGDYALFMGRLTEEKGVLTLLAAYEGLPPEMRLKVLGDGSLGPRLREIAQERSLRGVEFLEQRPQQEAMSLLRRARVLIFPSEWYEGLPLTLLEAFACGVPIVCSRIGSMQEVVEHEKTGLLFDVGDPMSLQQALLRCWDNTDLLSLLSKNGRAEYERLYTQEKASERLLQIYHSVLAQRSSR